MPLDDLVSFLVFLFQPMLTFRRYNADDRDGVYSLQHNLPAFDPYASTSLFLQVAVVDSRTFDQHKRNDLSKHVHDAITATTTACKSQDDAIAEHLVSGDCPINSNSTTPLHQSTTSSSQFSGKPTKQKLVEKPLCQLRDIETLLEDLTASVHGNLGGIGTPGTANDAFPLLPAISTARTLQNQRLGLYPCKKPSNLSWRA